VGGLLAQKFNALRLRLQGHLLTVQQATLLPMKSVFTWWQLTLSNGFQEFWRSYVSFKGAQNRWNLIRIEIQFPVRITIYHAAQDDPKKNTALRLNRRGLARIVTKIRFAQTIHSSDPLVRSLFLRR